MNTSQPTGSRNLAGTREVLTQSREQVESRSGSSLAVDSSNKEIRTSSKQQTSNLGDGVGDYLSHGSATHNEYYSTARLEPPHADPISVIESRVANLVRRSRSSRKASRMKERGPADNSYGEGEIEQVSPAEAGPGAHRDSMSYVQAMLGKLNSSSTPSPAIIETTPQEVAEQVQEFSSL